MYPFVFYAFLKFLHYKRDWRCQSLIDIKCISRYAIIVDIIAKATADALKQ